MADTEIELADLIRFYQHPSRWYAQRALSVYFEQTEPAPSDIEQFSYDRLASYQLKQALLETSLSSAMPNGTKEVQAAQDDVKSKQGSLVDSPIHLLPSSYSINGNKITIYLAKPLSKLA